MPLIERARHVIVRAKHVEVPGRDAVQHDVDRLLRRPRAGGLLDPAIGGERGEHEAGDEQMRRDLAVRRVAQFVLQRLGERLHTGLGDIVGGIARRRGDALLGAGVDDQRGRPLRDHIRCEHLRTVDDAPEIDAEDALPIVLRAEHLAARLDAGIVHQHVDRAEPLPYLGFEIDHAVAPADIHLGGHDGLAAFGQRGELRGRRVQSGIVDIGDADIHAESGEAPRGGKADAGGASGDDGGVVGRQGGMGHKRFSGRTQGWSKTFGRGRKIMRPRA